MTRQEIIHVVEATRYDMEKEAQNPVHSDGALVAMAAIELFISKLLVRLESSSADDERISGDY